VTNPIFPMGGDNDRGEAEPLVERDELDAFLDSSLASGEMESFLDRRDSDASFLVCKGGEAFLISGGSGVGGPILDRFDGAETFEVVAPLLDLAAVFCDNMIGEKLGRPAVLT